MSTLNELDSSSKVWIYQASRELKTEEVQELSTAAEAFCKGWTAHNAQLKAGFEIRYNRFIIFAVDESHNTASGCSIDKSVHFLTEAGKRLQVGFFDKLQMFYHKGDSIAELPMAAVQQAWQSGEINQDTIFINTLAGNIEEYRKKFEIPFSLHWLSSRIKV